MKNLLTIITTGDSNITSSITNGSKKVVTSQLTLKVSVTSSSDVLNVAGNKMNDYELKLSASIRCATVIEIATKHAFCK